MDNPLEEILKSIEIDKTAKRLSEMRDIVLTTTPDNAEWIIELISDDMGRGHFVGSNWSENEPYYYLFEAYAYEILRNQDNAIVHASLAVSLFNGLNSAWNESMTHWFLGIVYRNHNRVGKAEDEFKLALGILKKLASLAKEEFKYQTPIIYNAQIEEIERVLNKLPSHTSQHPVTDELRVSYEVFTKIIGLLEIPPAEFYHEWLEAIYSLEPSELTHINQQIEILTTMLEQKPDIEPITVSLVDIFLAHCYTLGYFVGGDPESISLAVKYAEDAIAGFNSLTADYNQALTNWYLALIYRSIADTDKSISRLHESNNLIQGLLEQYQDTDIYAELQSLQRDVQTWIEPTKVQTILTTESSQKQQIEKPKMDKKPKYSSWLGIGRKSQPRSPQPTPFRKNESSTPLISLRSKDTDRTTKKEDRSPKNESTPPVTKQRRQLQHVIIPVDLQALQELNPNSIRLEPHLFQDLQSYGEKIEANNVQQPRNPDSTETTPRPNQRKIPSFPIYGQAAAGPKGEPNLESTELDKAPIVYDDLCINFGGNDYDVRFIENAEYNFLSWRIYGWLQVIGDSMNDCSPIPIKDGSYILFAENRDIESCATKIVVAVLPEVDTQPAQVVVKRLIKLSTQLPSRSDGFASEYSKFMLHSESTFEKDPKTGWSYKNDIEIVRDNQIIGEVIAVAS